MASEGNGHSQLKADIINSLKNQEQSLSRFRNEIHSKDVIIFLGNTRSGKSTLVNYIIGNKLEGYESDKMEYKIRLMEECEGPEIGQGSLSCTTLPGIYKLKQNNTSVAVDPPGFEDNRGVVQDIINALCISQIKHARTVKFVLVLDIAELASDNIHNFINSLNQAQDLVSNFGVLKNSFSIVFTKDWKNYNEDEIIKLFQNKILNADKLDMDKVLVTNFAKNRKLIGIFRMPTRAGEIAKELDVNLIGAIDECHAIDVEKCEIKFALSDKAKEALLQIYPEYTDTSYFEEEVNRLIQKHRDYFDTDKYVFASYDEELAITKMSLEEIASSLLKNYKDKKPTRLINIQTSLDQILDPPVAAEFRTNFKFVIMLDESSMLEEKYKEMIVTNYIDTLEKLHSKVSKLLDKINAELSERKKNKIKFGGGVAAGVIGAVPAAVGTAKAIDCAVKTGSFIQKVVRPGVQVYGAAEGAIGSCATAGICIGGAAVAGFGAGTAYVLYKETYGKRKDARREQGRRIA